MPHSVSSDDTPRPDGEDQILDDAPPVDTAMKEESSDEEKLAKPSVKLEEMFDGDEDEDDEEFPTSSAVDTKMESSPPPVKASIPTSTPSGVDTDVMLAFYQRLFPFRYIFQWLNHDIVPSADFGNREFAVTLQNDAYLRYQSYATADLFRKDIIRMNPSRFEIGPVYSNNPRDRKTLRGGQMKPVSKELVFDIDLTDYDDIRTCCAKANICNKCWAFVTMSIKVIDTALREDFGFEHIMWVYSGRRGAHAWVCDKRARLLPDDRRRAIAGYLELVKGGDKSGKRVNLKRPLHPHVDRSLDILKPYFAKTTLGEQDTFENSEQAERLLSLLPDKPLNDALRQMWESDPDRPSRDKWADIDKLAKSGKSRNLDTKALHEAKLDVVLEYTYPRLDAEVSKKMIHLLKSPFVVHPGTGRVCVPIDGRNPEDFDPLSVPTVTELLSEIDEYDAKHPTSSSEMAPTAPDGEGSTANMDSDIKGGRRIPDYEKTRLKPYVDHFRSFIANLLKEERSVKREREEESAAAKGADAMEF